MGWERLLELLVPSAFAAGAAYAAVRIELRFLWRDVNRLHDRIGMLERGVMLPPRRRWSDRASVERDS